MITAPTSHIAASIAFALASDAGTPALSARAPEHLQPAGHSLWRVIAAQGRVLGHLAAVDHPLGSKFVARRYHPAAGKFRDLGEFWSADDALECLRHAG